MERDADVLIVGGGLVGQSLCCALEGSGLAAIQIEAEAPRAPDAPRWDERNFALARRSMLALERFGVWPHAAGHAQPIRHVHVSSRGDFGVVRVNADDYAVPALGYAVPARAVAAALAARLAACTTVRRRAPARLLGLEAAGDHVAARIEDAAGEHTLGVRLVVGADGTASSVRQLAGIGTELRDYGQTAVVCTVESDGAPEAWGFERFTDSGPFALLPLGGGRLGMIWSVADDDAPRVLGLDDAAFLEAAQTRFGRRAGRFRRVGRRQPWPLRLTRSLRVVAPRCVLVGNAAQTIHPVGAQGFNLGLRDVDALAERLRVAAGADVGDADRLAAYAAVREPDRAATIRLSDGLARGFAQVPSPLRALRGVALAALERLPLLKQDLAFALMGWRDAGDVR
jgi:2-octaprenyl-6-methoxyphenol hydroxylase